MLFLNFSLFTIVYSLKIAKYEPKDVAVMVVSSNKELCLNCTHGLRVVEDCIGLSHVEHSSSLLLNWSGVGEMGQEVSL